jgi:hypothetical protein
VEALKISSYWQPSVNYRQPRLVRLPKCLLSRLLHRLRHPHDLDLVWAMRVNSGPGKHRQGVGQRRLFPPGCIFVESHHARFPIRSPRSSRISEPPKHDLTRPTRLTRWKVILSIELMSLAMKVYRIDVRFTIGSKSRPALI